MLNISNINNFKDILDYQNYYIIKENIVYKIKIGKTEKDIFIKYKNYISIINLEKLMTLTGNSFNSIDIAYNFIVNIFDENKIIIKDIQINKVLKLIMNIKDKEIEINLFYINNMKFNSKSIINEINKLKNDIKDLKEENNKLKNEIDKLKNYHNNDNPKNIQLLTDLTYDAFAEDNTDNSFTVFKDINNLLYIVYTNERKSIISYNLDYQKKITEIKNCHFEYITNFRYYLDSINKRDIIMSLSCKDNNLKLWNTLNWECILNLVNINTNGDMFSACFMNENNNIYIISSNCNWSEATEKIKVYDFNGQKIREVDNSNHKSFYIDSYYDKNYLKNYIITGNYGYAISYDYNKNDLYHIYNENDKKCHLSMIIYNNEEKTKLIESSTDGNIRIWDFHSGAILDKIRISSEYLRGICLYNSDYLFVGCDDKTIKIIELKTKLIIKSLNGHNNKVLAIKKIMHPHYGECLISQGYENDQIKIWTNFIQNK